MYWLDNEGNAGTHYNGMTRQIRGFYKQVLIKLLSFVGGAQNSEVRQDKHE